MQSTGLQGFEGLASWQISGLVLARSSAVGHRSPTKVGVVFVSKPEGLPSKGAEQRTIGLLPQPWRGNQRFGEFWGRRATPSTHMSP